MACSPRGCNCALSGPAVLGGSGESGDPYIIETGIPTFCTSLTRPSSPFQGQVIYETDTDRTWIHDGADWKIQHDPLGYAVTNFSPAGNTDATTGATPALWLTLPSVTAPPWATRLVAKIAINGHYLITDTASYFMYPRLGGVAAGNVAAMPAYHAAPSLRASASAIASWSGVVGDTVYPMSLYAARAGGAGVLRADATTLVTVEASWKES